MSAAKLKSLDDAQPTRSAAIGVFIIIALTLVAYFPVMSRGGFIWDDDSYVTANQFLRHGWEGLWRMWIPNQTPQYYPVVFTTFWIEHQLWGLNPTGYHIVNVLLHAMNAALVFLLARKLKLPWPWLIGAIWALHPVNVESVAWITERKNTLSAFFYLIAAIAYLRFDDDQARETAHVMDESDRRWWFYAFAMFCFVLALLSKSVTCSLPAALILMMLWQRRRLTLARLAPLTPFFAIGLALALNTARIERDHVGATGEAFDFSIADRLIIASKALLFYPSTIVWPWPVMFIYPRWIIDDSQVAQFWSVAAVIVIAFVAIVLYARGRRGFGLGLAFFAGTIFPALGFVNVYPMIFSFVADHFQYLASLGIIALIVAGMAMLLKSQRAMIFVSLIVLPALGVLTWRQADTYRDEATVWRDTLEKNDEAFMPHNNLATYLLRQMEDSRESGNPADQQRADALLVEAQTHLSRALDLHPEYPQALTNMSDVLRLQGKYEEGLQFAQQGLRNILAKREVREAIGRSEERISAPIATANWDVGRLQELLGRDDEALASYRESLKWNPDSLDMQLETARLLIKLNRGDEAGPHFEAALRIDPNNFVALGRLATIRERQKRFADALALLSRALDVAPPGQDRLTIFVRIVRLRATADDANVRDTKQAVAMMENVVQQSQRRDPALLDILASVLADDGRTSDALKTAEEAAGLAERMQLTDLAKQIRARAEQYRTRGQPPAMLGPATMPR